MKHLAILLVLIFPNFVLAGDEISLFSGSGDAAAYIDISEELTIYLWSGEPVAYLSEDNLGGYHVYGFNGKHLGWFVGGAIRDHKGDAACATKEIMNSTKYEPYKAYKQYKAYKAYKEYAPYRPSFSNNFGQIPCNFLLASGSTE
ncbi:MULTISPECIES: 4-fold beta flower protein [unclassified Pseudoalteromonas]|uniref:4-fold beta flower protein n=1 Tax=unclassified Pseudoalteromonas TaxID=194690 RepID=UPI0016033437|nr:MULTISPECIES: hypothetical protein [unclassified Pseudoalteromonas]MBB1332759.1 hypothetical protein [Pseudoalteromonas sp. SR41-6]MBB1459269.1 hypothetical protein [Pseudoalteromonas sp. SG41-8]